MYYGLVAMVKGVFLTSVMVPYLIYGARVRSRLGTTGGDTDILYPI